MYQIFENITYLIMENAIDESMRKMMGLIKTIMNSITWILLQEGKPDLNIEDIMDLLTEK
jgi:hypothetical protein